MKISVIIPVFNAEQSLPSLIESLSNQSFDDFEVIVVDDCSTDDTSYIAQSYECRLIRLGENRGPAHARNIGAEEASGDILAFSDGDCKVEQDWVENIHNHFSRNDCEAIMGKLILLPSTILGDSISALGFPAGGSIGFDRIWKVDANGFTDSLSSCNCAIKEHVFQKVGGFDEAFPYAGGEDSLLAYQLRENNFRIKYCPDVLVYHDARDSFRDFLKWQFHRGISAYIFSIRIAGRKSFVSLRLWSTGNIIRHYCFDKKIPLILFLLGTSFFVQCIGFLFARYKRMFYANPNHQSSLAWKRLWDKIAKQDHQTQGR
jgi:glycosyltransferase involved in cell wall biosynthesis